jgi:CHAD domain-containing protein
VTVNPDLPFFVPAPSGSLPAARPPSRFNSGDEMARVGALVMEGQLCAVMEEEAAAHQADPDAIHDMRVAVRRLRSAFSVFAPFVPRQERRGLRKGLARLATFLGDVRDMDVFLAQLAELRSDEKDAALARFTSHLEERRAAARARLLDYLDGRERAHWHARLEALLKRHHVEPGAEAVRSDRRIRPSSVASVVPSEIWREYGRMRAYDAPAKLLDDSQLHGLRIAGKHLRYTLEAFSEVLGDKQNRLLRPLRALQDALGSVHDTQVLIGLLLEFECRAGTPDRVTPLIVGLRSRRQDAQTEFERIWPEIVGQIFRDGLARAVACI